MAVKRPGPFPPAPLSRGGAGGSGVSVAMGGKGGHPAGEKRPECLRDDSLRRAGACDLNRSYRPRYGVVKGASHVSVGQQPLLSASCPAGAPRAHRGATLTHGKDLPTSFACGTSFPALGIAPHIVPCLP